MVVSCHYYYKLKQICTNGPNSSKLILEAVENRIEKTKQNFEVTGFKKNQSILDS